MCCMLCRPLPPPSQELSTIRSRCGGWDCGCLLCMEFHKKKKKYTLSWMEVTCADCLITLAEEVGLVRDTPRDIIIDKWLEEGEKYE